jgi:lipid-binding SYLF domain-containing protein
MSQETKHTTKAVLPYLLVVMSLLILPVWAVDKEKDEETLKDAAKVLEEMLSVDSVPKALIAKADCIIVLPNVKKFSIGVGGSGGRGAMSCRSGKTFAGKWSAPALFTIGGVSAGFQIGGSSTDFVLLVMDKKAVDAILKGKTKLGRDATAAVGPSGANTSGAVEGSEILTYGRAKGLFAGISVGDAVLDPDNDANHRVYGKILNVTEILIQGSVSATPAGQPLVSLLNSKAAKHGN